MTFEGRRWATWFHGGLTSPSSLLFIGPGFPSLGLTSVPEGEKRQKLGSQCDVLHPQKGWLGAASPERWSKMCLSQATAKLWRGLETPDGKENLVVQRPQPWVSASLSLLVRAEVPAAQVFRSSRGL